VGGRPSRALDAGRLNSSASGRLQGGLAGYRTARPALRRENFTIAADGTAQTRSPRTGVGPGIDTERTMARVSRPCSLALAGAFLSLVGCRGPVALAHADRAQLEALPAIPVVYRRSPAPGVDCSMDVNYETDVSCQIADQITASLRDSSPVDPAQATAVSFLDLIRDEQQRPRFGGKVHLAHRADLLAERGRTGLAPVLLFETTRWSLVGSFYSYRPSIIVRATLLNRSNGTVLWRDACANLIPPPSWRKEATVAELSANGKALYRSMIDDEARRCAGELLADYSAGTPDGTDE